MKNIFVASVATLMAMVCLAIGVHRLIHAGDNAGLWVILAAGNAVPAFIGWGRVLSGHDADGS